ncbi:CD15/CS22/SEF14 family fimbrial major subunit [Escherichia coli]|uniref:CD15/CS22/SEF14 family fimbrial major subunit n=1 Tax=Escherichia coli TaxID=562 RepID=UPI000E20374F|nr:CD15/CS22/SEF14 family fimbrial major subunit [Escherichia coli]EHY5882580.1 CD15/CS22/SEF14 family fimbrial major subunit [Escherichia coli]
MKKIVLSSLALAMVMGSVTAHAATIAGNKATVKAPVVISATNTTSATWAADAGFTGPKVAASQVIGALSIRASGPHDGVQVSGQGTQVSGGSVTIPFYNADGTTAGFWGTALETAWGHAGTTLMGTPGWNNNTQDESVTLTIKKLGNAETLTPGTYTATFEVVQYQN